MPDIKGWIVIAVCVAALGGAAFGGGTIGYWKASADYAPTIADLQTLNSDKDAQILVLTANNTTLLLGVAAQNQAVAVAEAKTQAAEQVAEQAKAFVTQSAAESEQRMKLMDKALKTAKTAEELLDRYWELRK